MSWTRASGRQAGPQATYISPGGRATAVTVHLAVGRGRPGKVPPSCWAISTSASNPCQHQPRLLSPQTPNPRLPSSSRAPSHNFQRGAADCASSPHSTRGGRRGGARRSDDNAQPRVGGTRHVGARRPRPSRRPQSPPPCAAPPPLLPLARSSSPAREPAVFAVAVPAPRTRGRIMSSPPEGKLETKAGHPPAGTDSFSFSVLPRGARAGSNPGARARGAEGAPGRGLWGPFRGSAD